MTPAPSYLGDVIGVLNNIGFFNIIIPMVLIYAMILGVLEKIAIFKKTPKEGTKPEVNKSVNAAIAFSLSFLTVGVGNLIGVLIEISTYFVLVVFIVIYALIVLTTIDLGSSSSTEGKILDKRWFKITFTIIILFVIGVLILLVPGANGILTKLGTLWTNILIWIPLVLIAVGTILFVYWDSIKKLRQGRA